MCDAVVASLHPRRPYTPTETVNTRARRNWLGPAARHLRHQLCKFRNAHHMYKLHTCADVLFCPFGVEMDGAVRCPAYQC